MRKNADKDKPPLVRLSEEELKKSRTGQLGRFPAPDLYEAEPLINLSEGAFDALGCPGCEGHSGTRETISDRTTWKCDSCGKVIGIITGSWAERVKEALADLNEP